MLRSHPLIVLLVLVEFASGVLQGGFPILLPQLASTLHFGAGGQSLALGVEFLVAGVAVPLTSRLGDLFGHRRLLLATLALTLLGYLATALARDLTAVLLGRALSGFLSCWLPLEFALLRDRLGEERGSRAVGLLVGSLTLGSITGAVLRPGLWPLALLPALALLVVWRWVPESRTRAQGRLDWLGALLLSGGLGLLFSGLSGHAWLLVPAVALLALFVRQELRTPAPTIDVRMLVRRATAPVFGLSFLLGCALYGSQAPTLSFQAARPAETGYGLAADSQLLGLLSLPAVLGALVGAVTADRLARRFGPRAVLGCGFALSAAGYTLIALAHAAAWQFLAPSALAGFGAGLGLSLLPGLLMHRLPADQTGVGTGVYNTLKTLAGATAGAVSAVLLDSLLLRPGIPDQSAYVTVWAGCAALCALGVPVAFSLRAERSSERNVAEPAVTA
ncbi:MFS family permease [Kitasatospora sp. MAA4]|uniref:MFS transporter n=1 Tax=Kitasatospora sp. MAA4 TaxID=3035093 RepID=UPI0024737DF5|nr:MFS transporter [Kitasatospora sp. MAA4]MDH6134119.1 MFS family permease [Kitasatospora sp. MAA4]